MDFVTFKEIKQIASDLLRWDVIEDIAFNEFVINPDVQYLREYEINSMGDYSERLKTYCLMWAEARYFRELEGVMGCDINVAKKMKSRIELLMKYHQKFFPKDEDNQN